MRLYVLPGACSLASHIALEVVAEFMPIGSAPWEVVVLQRGHNHDPEYTAVNPLGTVPALVTSDGRVIVESLAVLLHIAEAYPEARIAAPAGDVDRDRILTLLSVMVTAGHTSFQMLWRSERFADTEEGRASVQRMCEHRIGTLFERLEREIGKAGYLVGNRPSVADMYPLRPWSLGTPPRTSDESLPPPVEVHRTLGGRRRGAAGNGTRGNCAARAEGRARLAPGVGRPLVAMTRRRVC
jgi:glutathione S-transferase